MINHARVRRIKNVIYAVIVLLFLLPAILLIVVGFRMLRILTPLENIIAQSQISQAQASPPSMQSAPPEGYVRAPGQSYPEESQLPVPQGTGARMPSSSQPADDEESLGFESDSVSVPPGGGDGISRQQNDETDKLPVNALLPYYGSVESPNTGVPKKGER